MSSLVFSFWLVGVVGAVAWTVARGLSARAITVGVLVGAVVAFVPVSTLMVVAATVGDALIADANPVGTVVLPVGAAVLAIITVEIINGHQKEAGRAAGDARAEAPVRTSSP
ncbi:hypothetical protein [Gordonia phthalatica]|uniref:hypothetical protein n=1 Tax=Gordonia phthalatica TaxID=1136941 RepID=UPI0012FF3E8A|nr:hypothetical protein [Gordonia phthalatica]